MTLPAEVGKFTIRGRYLSAMLDGAEQEDVPLTGLTVTLTPTISPAMLKGTTSTPPVSILVHPVTVRTDADGVLVGDDGSTDTELIASDYPDPENPWAYRVKIVGPGVSLPEFSMVGLAGEVLDLTEVLEAPSGAGFDLSAWSALVVRAEAAREEANTARDAAVAAAASVPTPAELTATFVGKLDLVSKLTAPLYVAHRGGRSVFPEHSMEAYRASFASGFIPEQDLAALADGTIVCLHDSTVDRTMTGATGAVSALTRAQWLSARIRPVIKGGKTAVPVLWEDVLNEFGGRSVLMPEVKASDPVVMQAVIDSIVARGLERCVVVQSFDYSAAQAVAAAGIATLFLADAGTPEDMVSDGIEFAGPSLAASDAYVASLIAAGIKVIPYTAGTRAHVATQLARGAFGVFADDPWGLSGRYPVKGIEDFRDGFLWPLATTTIGVVGGEPVPAITLDPTIPGLHFTVWGATSTSANASIRLGQFGEGSTELRARFTVQFLANAQSSSRWLGLWVGSIVGDAPFNDGGTPSTAEGYHFLIRRVGEKTIYLRTLGNAAATQLGTHTSTTPFVAGTAVDGLPLEFEVVIDAANVTLRCLTDATGVTVANTAVRNVTSLLSLYANNTDVAVSNIRVSR